jgi:hypothetical protein
MIKSDKTARWLQYADSESGPLGRHLDRLAARRAVASAISTNSEPSSLAALIPIGMLTLFMLWAVINPV